MMNTLESLQKNALSGFSLRRKNPTPMRFISESTDVVYFDFSKAFGSVNHDLILDKLKILIL